MDTAPVTAALPPVLPATAGGVGALAALPVTQGSQAQFEIGQILKALVVQTEASPGRALVDIQGNPYLLDLDTPQAGQTVALQVMQLGPTLMLRAMQAGQTTPASPAPMLASDVSPVDAVKRVSAERSGYEGSLSSPWTVLVEQGEPAETVEVSSLGQALWQAAEKQNEVPGGGPMTALLAQGFSGTAKGERNHDVAALAHGLQQAVDSLRSGNTSQQASPGHPSSATPTDPQPMACHWAGEVWPGQLAEVVVRDSDQQQSNELTDICADLSMDLPAMGTVDARIRYSLAGVHLSLTASPETTTRLRANLPELANTLASLKIRVARIAVTDEN